MITKVSLVIDLQDEDPDIVSPQAEVFQVMVDPAPHARSYVEALAIYADSYGRDADDEYPRRRDGSIEYLGFQSVIQNDRRKCMQPYGETPYSTPQVTRGHQPSLSEAYRISDL